jgi:hypothetical protein
VNKPGRKPRADDAVGQVRLSLSPGLANRLDRWRSQLVVPVPRAAAIYVLLDRALSIADWPAPPEQTEVER